MARTTTTSGGPHRALKCCVMPLSLPPATPLCCPSPPPLIVWQCLQVQISKWIAFLSLGKVLQHAGNLSSCCFSHPTHSAQGYFPGKLVPATEAGKTWRKAELSGFVYGCCLVVTVCHTISAIRLMPPRRLHHLRTDSTLRQLTGYCRSFLAVSVLIELSPFSTDKGHLLTIIAFSYGNESGAQENCQQMSKTNLSINERTKHGKLLWLTINGQVFGKQTQTHTHARTHTHHMRARNLSKKFAKIMKHCPEAMEWFSKFRENANCKQARQTKSPN